ncbi:MAG: hypothetical protein LBE97_01915 [Holosporales bacterium]|jgi:hypothetical protein|nr:hypothetical protein [Holosporales bacterium]
MPAHAITKRFTFYGALPPGSDKSHLAIVLNEKENFVKYCYCTSVFNLSLLRYSQCDCFVIKADDMADYFPGSSKETYVYFSEDKIITITLGVLQIKLRNGEYEERKPLDEIIFSDLVEAIKLSDNLSERFKGELLDFIQ